MIKTIMHQNHQYLPIIHNKHRQLSIDQNTRKNFLKIIQTI